MLAQIIIIKISMKDGVINVIMLANNVRLGQQIKIHALPVKLQLEDFSIIFHVFVVQDILMIFIIQYVAYVVQ